MIAVVARIERGMAGACAMMQALLQLDRRREDQELARMARGVSG